MKKIYILTIACSSLILGSCDKALDLKPTEFIVEDKAFQNLNDLNQATLGVYAAINTEEIIYTNTLMADETRLSNQNTGQGQGAFKWQHDASVLGGDLTANWFSSYRAIDRANKALNAIDKVVAFNPTEEARKLVLKGELLTLRALAHFELVRMYSQGYNSSDISVPLVNSVILPDRASYPARNTVGQVLTSVKADLQQAKTLIPAVQTDIYRISRLTITATQARIALYEKDWSNAITFSTEIINALPLANAATYPTIFTDVSNAEVVFKLRRNVSTARPGDLWQRVSSNFDVFFAVSNKLLQTFSSPTRDVRYRVNVRLDATRPEPELVNKYPGVPGLLGFQDIKFYRTSEMFLIRAEAYAETTGSIALGFADLNSLRAARITNYVPVIITDKNLLINEIYNERFIELAFEGHRYFDLKRRNLTITRLASDRNNAPEAISLPSSNFRYILPLPQSETFANTNLVNNPNY